MTDRGSTLVETVIAVTVSGVGGLAVLGAVSTLALTSSAAAQRSQSAVALLSAQTYVSHLADPCSSIAEVPVGATVLDPCPGPGPHRIRLSTSPGPGHRHLTVVVDGGP
jgi:hypothetical protein